MGNGWNETNYYRYPRKWWDVYYKEGATNIDNTVVNGVELTHYFIKHEVYMYGQDEQYFYYLSGNVQLDVLLDIYRTIQIN